MRRTTTDLKAGPRFGQLKLVLAGLLLLAGRVSAFSHASASDVQRFETNSVSATNALAGKWHSVTISPSPRTPKITSCDKLSLAWWFGNADEPVPPAWFKPGGKGRSWKWFWRNPFHNFTHYVIGVADHEYVRSGRYPDKISNPNGGWNFTIAKYGLWRLPFISYRRGKFEFYFGWRVRGNFGIKINWNPERTHPLPGEAPRPKGSTKIPAPAPR